MLIELNAKKERIEAELSATLYGLKKMDLENWERKSFEADASELMDSLEHTVNCIEIYS